jgi:DNA-binding response OmpR family regulator
VEGLKIMSKPKKSVLIVDDDERIRESVRLAIQEHELLDINILESSSVASGIHQLKRMKPDVVILDLHLPDKTGFDFMDIMHRDKHIPKTTVIMLTADDSIKNIFTAEARGINPYYVLGKPFNISDLLAMVLEVCLGGRA